MPILAKRVYEPRDAADGHRLLVMRYWPRGVRKEHVDAWERALAPSRELLADLRGEATRGVPPFPTPHTIDWPEYVRRYRFEMATRPDAMAAIAVLRERAVRETVTVLCWCHDEAQCHRGLLKELVEAG